MKKILFIDDEINVLHGLRRMLRGLTNEYEMFFANSSAGALKMFETTKIDVVVTDLRMPEKDGVYLLEKVRNQYPNTVRIVLSGYADKDIGLKTVGLAHQFISKPANPDILKKAIRRACLLHDLVTDPELKKLLLRINTLPSLPDLYYKIVVELNSPETSTRKVGEIIAQDMGMTTRILQLVNSSYFGLSIHIDDPIQATTLLGLVTVRDLALSLHVFSQFSETLLRELGLSKLWDHSLRVAGFTKIILNDLVSDPKRREMGFVLGLLHDLGKLVIAQNMPMKYKKVLDHARNENMPLIEAEKQVLNTTHADVGAYLLGIWGLDEVVMDTTAYHHKVDKYHGEHGVEVAAVHIANGFANNFAREKPLPLEEIELNLPFIQSLKLDQHLVVWQEKCKQFMLEGIQNA